MQLKNGTEQIGQNKMIYLQQEDIQLDLDYKPQQLFVEEELHLDHKQMQQKNIMEQVGHLVVIWELQENKWVVQEL